MMDNNQIQALGGNFTIDSILSHQKALQHAPTLNMKREHHCITTQANSNLDVSEMVAAPKEKSELHRTVTNPNAGKSHQSTHRKYNSLRDTGNVFSPQ